MLGYSVFWIRYCVVRLFCSSHKELEDVIERDVGLDRYLNESLIWRVLSLYRLRRCHHPIWNLHLFMNNFFSREIYRFMNYGHAQSVFKWAKKSLDFLILENSFLSTLIHFMTFLYARWRFLLTNHQKIRETLFMFIIQATESKTALNLTILFCRKFSL